MYKQRGRDGWKEAAKWWRGKDVELRVCVCVRGVTPGKGKQGDESESIAKQAKSENKPFLFDFWSIFQKWSKKV